MYFVNRKGLEVGWWRLEPNKKLIVIWDKACRVDLDTSVQILMYSRAISELPSGWSKNLQGFETYFQDWTHPTEQEAEMFFMLFGVEIPWISIELEVE